MQCTMSLEKTTWQTISHSPTHDKDVQPYYLHLDKNQQTIQWYGSSKGIVTPSYNIYVIIYTLEYHTPYIHNISILCTKLSVCSGQTVYILKDLLITGIYNKSTPSYIIANCYINTNYQIMQLINILPTYFMNVYYCQFDFYLGDNICRYQDLFSHGYIILLQFQSCLSPLPQ